MDTPTSLPDRFAAGTTVKYTRSLADYLASDLWVLTLVIAGAVNRSFTATTNVDGRSFDLLLPYHDAGSGPATDELTPGVYTAAEYVAKGTERYQVGGPWTIQVLPDLTENVDQQLWLEKIVAALRARVSGQLAAGSEMAKVEVEGRAVEFYSPMDAAKLLDIYESRLRSLLSGGALTVPVEVHFQ